MAEAAAHARLVRAARRLAEAVNRRDEARRRAEAAAFQLAKEFQEGLGRLLRDAMEASMTVEVGDGLRLRIAARGEEVEVKLSSGEALVVHEDERYERAHRHLEGLHGLLHRLGSAAP